MSSVDKNNVAGQVTEKLDRLDSYQKQHKVAGVAIAVLRKFVDDRSLNLAAMIAFWAFFSVFPLLLVLVTLLGYLLPSGVKGAVLSNVASYFPLLDTASIRQLSGRWWSLAVGLVSALFSGSFVVMTVQDAFNSVWEIPYTCRPKLGDTVKRIVGVLGTIGLGLVLSTLISGFVTGGGSGVNLGALGQLVGYLITITLDSGLFIAAFRILSARNVSIRDVLPGAVLSGAVFWVLQQLSSLIISGYLHDAQRTYGGFATVITMLWWFYLQSIVTLLGAQLNVVLKDRLHPRGLRNPPDTEADYCAYQAYAQERTYHDQERIQVDFPTDQH